MQGDTVRSPWDSRYNQGLSGETGMHAQPTRSVSPVVWSRVPGACRRVRCLLSACGAESAVTGLLDVDASFQCCVLCGSGVG